MQQHAKQQRFAILTLGCKVNQEEGNALANVFLEHGWQQVNFSEMADVYLINTCTVTHLADRKSRQMVRRAIRMNPAACVAVTGCYAQMGKEELLAINGVNLIVGTNDRHRLYDLVQTHLANPSLGTQVVVSDVVQAKDFLEIGNHYHQTKRTRAFLKIEDGCSQFCSYCIIPYARGPVRSKPLLEVVAEAEEIIAAGYQEIVLTGIHTGAYGRDFVGQQICLEDLVAALVELPGLARLRLGSIEPQEVTPGLIGWMAKESRICPHFHIPLQAAQDEILQAMNRHYQVAEYQALLAEIRRQVPNVAITTDVIVGFPGETAADFAAGLANIKACQFADLHIFPYSPRKGTPAATFPQQVPAAEKEKRAHQLQQVAALSRQYYWQQQLGQQQPVLLEQQEKLNDILVWTGHSPNYLPVAVPADAFTISMAGQIVWVEIKKITDQVLWGEPILK